MHFFRADGSSNHHGVSVECHAFFGGLLEDDEITIFIHEKLHFNVPKLGFIIMDGLP